MHLYTPIGLFYPIKVTRLLRQPGDEIQRDTPLFNYEYKSKVLEGTPDNKEGDLVERTWPATFESELEGTLASLDVHVGQIIPRKTLVAEIEEACTHEVQFGGMCANCGKDMKETSYNTTVKATDRARINTVHDRETLLISQDEASRADDEAKRRLLGARKLTLVVDLDQTVIQACVESTIGEWQNDPSNPNYEALKDVHSFQIPRDPKTYYLKPRPGLPEFLEAISERFEMHVYTMATRDYAHIVTSLIDPEGKIFGGRILSRDENGPEMRKQLKRLFPVDTRMVIIIDDRGDIWQWSPNLIKVTPFDFFVGIGDINSSFLPKRQELEAKPTVKPAKIEKAEDSESPASTDTEKPSEASSASSTPSTAPTTPPAEDGDLSAVDRMVAMAGKQDESTMQDKINEQDEQLAEQLAERPLLQKQKQLDAEEEKAKASPAVETTDEILKEHLEHEALAEHRYRHNLLQDDDNELEWLELNLKDVHRAFFETYDGSLPGTGDAGRVAELKPGKASKRPVLDDLRNIPDAAAIMSGIKAQVLAGCHLVFSGVVPLGVNIHSHDAVIWAKTFGATVSENITRKTTHVIASPERRTAKVRQAAKRGGKIWIVDTRWLTACFSEWRHYPEDQFAIHSSGPANGVGGDLPESFEGGERAPLSESEEEAALTEPEPEGDGEHEAKDEVDTDDGEDLEKHRPSNDRADSSPLLDESPEDWDDIDKELEEFMKEDDERDRDRPKDDDVSDSEGSVRSDGWATPVGGKRKRDEDGESVDGEEGEEEGSRLQKRKKEALGRTSSLNQTAVVGEKGDGAAAVAVEPGGKRKEVMEGDEDEDDLEAALAAEMERQDDEDGE